MSIDIERVGPGDLITASFFNRLVRELGELDDRLSKLEGAGVKPLAPVLIRREPTGDVEVGSLLTLVGKHFLQPPDQNTVTLGSRQIKQFAAGSDEEHLIIEVPAAFSSLPASLPVSVHNPNGDSGELTVRVLEHFQPQGGEVVFDSKTAAGQAPTVGQAMKLEWDVDSRTLLPETYALSAVYVNPVGASEAAWAQATTVVPATAKIARGDARRVTLTVVVPPGAQSVDLALKATAQEHAELTKTSSPVQVHVGQPIPTSDSRTQMTLQNLPANTDQNPPAANPARLVIINGNSGMEVQLGQEALMFVSAGFDESGKYVYTAEIEQGGAAWAARIQPTGTSQAAGSTRQLAAHLLNKESTVGGPTPFMVVRAAKRNAADTANDFVSFVRFPVRGFAP